MLCKDQKLDSFQYKWVNGSIVWACGPKLLRPGPSLCLIRSVQTAWRNCHKQNQWSFRTVICGLCRTCEEGEVITFCVHLRKPPKWGGFPAQSEWNSNFDLLNEFAVHFALARHRRLWDKLFKLMNWLLHSSSILLCGQSLDVHCRLERINRKSNFWNYHEQNFLASCLDWCKSQKI